MFFLSLYVSLGKNISILHHHLFYAKLMKIIIRSKVNKKKLFLVGKHIKKTKIFSDKFSDKT